MPLASSVITAQARLSKRYPFKMLKVTHAVDHAISATSNPHLSLQAFLLLCYPHQNLHLPLPIFQDEEDL